MNLSPESRSLRNLECWFEETGCPGVVIADGPLAPRVDRAFFVWTSKVEAWMDANMDRWDIKIADHQPLGYETAVRGWRERRARWAAQAIKHYSVEAGCFGECDFDDANPNWGLLPLILHGIQWLRGKRGYKVDPRKVAKARGWEILYA